MKRVRNYILSGIAALGLIASSCEKDRLAPEPMLQDVPAGLEYVVQNGEDTTATTMAMAADPAYFQRGRPPRIVLFKASGYHVKPGDTIDLRIVAYDHENDTARFLFRASGGKLLRTTKHTRYDPPRLPDMQGHVPQVGVIEWVAPQHPQKDTYRIGAFAFDKHRNGYDTSQLRVSVER